MCKICDITNEGIEQVPPSPFDENDFNRISNGVWIGEFTVDNLPVPTYIKTAEFLKSGVNLGFAEYDKVDELLKADIMNNIYLFSGTKTYQQVRTLTSLLADPELKSNYYKFKEASTPILHDYNVAYLQTEYYTAKGSSRMAAFWDRIGQEADVLPLLKYQTVGDARVRPTHQALDNIIRPVTDPFWNNYFPPNGWRCFEGDTLVLTKSGYKQIRNIAIGDIVIGGSGKEQYVDFVHINQFKGYMVTLSSKNISVTSTENHRYLTMDGWVNAENIEIGDIVVQLDDSVGFYKVIRAINNVYVIINYLFMSFVRKWKSRMTATLNRYVKRWNKNINP